MKKLVIALATAFVLLAGPAEANGRHHRGGPYRGGHHHGGHYRGGFGWGGFAVYPRVFIGGPDWWGNPYPYDPYPYYPYRYDRRPIVIERSQPQVYVQQPQPEPRYWYYCENPRGYYPSVERCRSGWLQVPPRTDSPDE